MEGEISNKRKRKRQKHLCSWIVSSKLNRRIVPKSLCIKHSSKTTSNVSIESLEDRLFYMKRRKIESDRLIQHLKANNEKLVQTNIDLMSELRINQNKITALSNELLFKQVALKKEYVLKVRSQMEALAKNQLMERDKLHKNQEQKWSGLINMLTGSELNNCIVFCEPNMSLASSRLSVGRPSLETSKEHVDENGSRKNSLTPSARKSHESMNNQKRYYLSDNEKENHRKNSLNVHIGNYIKNVGPPLTPLLEISSAQVSSQKSNTTLVRSDHDNFVDTTIDDMSLTMFEKSLRNPSSQEERLPHDATTSTPSIFKFEPLSPEEELGPGDEDEQLSRPSFLDEDYEYESESFYRMATPTGNTDMLPRISYFHRPSFLQSIEFNPTENLCHLDVRLPSEIPTLTSSAYHLSPTLTASSQEETVVPMPPPKTKQRANRGKNRSVKKQTSTSNGAKDSGESEKALRSLENTTMNSVMEDSARTSNDCDTSLNASLRSTRHKKPVSYQEPKCNRKIRKGDTAWCKT